MRLICPNCDAQYEIDAALIPEQGREVQCSACAHVWIQGHEPVAPDEPASVFVAPQMPAAAVPAGGAGGSAAAEPGGQDAATGTGEAVDPEERDPEDRANDPPLGSPPEEPASVATPGAATPAEDDAVARAGVEATQDVPSEPREDAAETGHAPPGADVPEAPDVPDAPGAAADAAGTDRDGRAAEAETDGTASPPLPERPPVDPEVLAILKAEAERELAARASERVAAKAAALETAQTPDPGGAEAAGVPAPAGEMVLRRQSILPDMEEITSTLTATADRGTAPPSEDAVRQRSGFRLGFGAVLGIVALALALYVVAPQLARAVPALEPVLVAYVDAANVLRHAIDRLFATVLGAG